MALDAQGRRVSPAEQLRQRHQELHRSFDELIACYIATTGNLPSQTSLLDFMGWSHLQTISPACAAKGHEHG